MTHPIQSSGFKQVFKHNHAVLPVIHVENQRQALNNAEIAFNSGADGIFLINHSISSKSLLAIHPIVCEYFPSWWVGVNCLDLTPSEVFLRIPSIVSGVWADNAMIREDQDAQPRAEEILAARQKSGWTGLYFGGVAFKYQRHVDDLTSAASIASHYVDVVTTSGTGTGLAAHIEKIRAMKQALGSFPLAIASGITPANIERYLPVSDCYLVATGISRSFTEFEPKLVRDLVEKVRLFDGNEAKKT